MSFRVRWKRVAQNQLAALWLDSTNRQAVTAAAHAVDTSLRRDPVSCGESRSGNRRVLFEPPLVVAFEVHEDQRKVTVISVRGCALPG